MRLGAQNKPEPLAQRPYSATARVRGAVEEFQGMSLVFTIEASKSDGTVYRLLFGLKFALLPLVSLFTAALGLH